MDTASTHEILIPSADRFRLLLLAADVRVREEELRLAQVRADVAQAISDAAGDELALKLGVPSTGLEITIDINAGVVRFKTPAV